jgi:uncharacterized membrane protein YtjA (UPF0391 family)
MATVEGEGFSMWQYVMLPLLLAIASAALLFNCGSSCAAGLAILLFVAFIGLGGIMLAIGRRESHSWS